MTEPEIRQSQLVTTFGPGSMVDLPQHSVLIGGLQFWDFKRGGTFVEERRLAAKVKQVLKTDRIELRAPPQKVEAFGERERLVTVFQFPEWFVTQDVLPNNLPYKARSRRLIHRRDQIRGRTWTDEDRKKRTVVPIRFVRACPKGHIGDVNWREFVHHGSSSCLRELWVDEVGISGDLGDVWIRCGCKQKRKMIEASQMELLALGHCNGSRPWLGRNSNEDCGLPNRLLIRTASNSYFPQILSVISIPETVDDTIIAVDELWDQGLSKVKSQDALSQFRDFNTAGLKRLAGMDDQKIWEAVEIRRGGAPSARDRPIKELEAETLNDSKEELGSDIPSGDFYARALPQTEWVANETQTIERVVLVHRLREVAALVGFTRFEAMSPDVNGELD